ncbi:MAG: restriction endonuclease subunit S [Ahniella sp.]|nr:restriction endonuclease subunit S [Ahniella sp.]
MSPLPKGWSVSTIPELCDVLDSLRVPINSDERNQRIAEAERVSLVPYFGATGQVGWIDTHLFDEDLVLLGEDGVPFLDPAKPKAYRVSGKSWVNNHAHVLRVRDEFVDWRFLAAQLNAIDYTSFVSGSTRLKLTQGAMNRLPIRVAPRSEQERIADKLETVLTHVDAVLTRLARIAPLLKRFRQSVLAAATSGRLTHDWRSNEAPEWSELRFSDAVLESSTGLVRSATDQAPMREGLTPYLKMNSIEEVWGYHCKDLPGVHCSTEEFDRFELAHGDWLFNTRNSVELVGKSCVWNGPAGVVFNNNLLRVRFKAAINPNWVEIYFRSPIGRNLLNAVKSATTSVAAIYQRSLMELPLKLPPEREQTEIVRRVETLLAFADRLDGRLQTAQTVAGRLAPALLAKAFRGELVPQDPNDEPASELLRRLQPDQPARKSTRGRRAAA